MTQTSAPINQETKAGRTRFLVVNLLKGLLWMAIIVGGYFYLSSHFDFSLEKLLGSYYEKPKVIYSCFLTSEVFFGLIPPELFMIWALRSGDLSIYIHNVMALSALSYTGGIIAYYIGRQIGNTRLYRIFRVNYLRKIEKHFVDYGGFLLVVAALTPLPFSSVCMLTGAVKYRFSKLLIFTSVRFLRFAVYAFIIWETHMLQ